MKNLLVLLFLFFIHLSSTFSQEHASTTRVYLMVDEMPRMTGCEDLKNLHEKEACAKFSLHTLISETHSFEPGSKVILGFIVDKDGTLRDINIEQEIDKESDIILANIISEMPAWIPGKEDGIAVPVQIYIALDFPLELEPEEKESILIQNRKDEIFVLVEEMPRYPGCEEEPSQFEKEQCA